MALALALSVGVTGLARASKTTRIVGSERPKTKKTKAKKVKPSKTAKQAKASHSKPAKSTPEKHAKG